MQSFLFENLVLIAIFLKVGSQRTYLMEWSIRFARIREVRLQEDQYLSKSYDKVGRANLIDPTDRLCLGQIQRQSPQSGYQPELRRFPSISPRQSLPFRSNKSVATLIMRLERQ
ncbi:hypothetical protein UF64_10090 [Thalassospira sp. HJ]|nr:hypothetical protein UF64_10090 [Thalassospira sp. HJ]